MTTRHQYRIYIKAPVERVWAAITEPGWTARYFYGAAFDSAPSAGQPYRMIREGTTIIDGTIEVIEAPNRLVQTWQAHFAPGLADEPPGRVEWTLTAVAEGVTRVDLVHGDLFNSPITWAAVKDGWVWVLDGLKTVVETGESLPPVPPAPDSPDDAEGEWHRTAAIAANNALWGLLDAAASPERDEDLLRHAYAAAYHWDRAARRTAANGVRADYMIAKAWLAAGRGELALAYAERCLDGCRSADLADFDLAYGHEIRARALACVGRLDEAADELARVKAVEIADADDRKLVESDLASEPWFGLTR